MAVRAVGVPVWKGGSCKAWFGPPAVGFLRWGGGFDKMEWVTSVWGGGGGRDVLEGGEAFAFSSPGR